MGKIMISKKDFLKNNKTEEVIQTKQGTSIMGIIGITVIAASAIAWIGFISIKSKGGRLPWEA